MLYHRATTIQWETKNLKNYKSPTISTANFKPQLYFFPPTRGKLDPFEITIVLELISSIG